MQNPAELDARERFHPRVDAGIMVKLLIDGRALLCKARDLSMAGLYIVDPPETVRERVNRVTISIPLPDDREVITSCIVRRVQDDGMGLEFDGIDWDDMFALARFLHPRLP